MNLVSVREASDMSLRAPAAGHANDEDTHMQSLILTFCSAGNDSRDSDLSFFESERGKRTERENPVSVSRTGVCIVCTDCLLV